MSKKEIEITYGIGSVEGENYSFINDLAFSESKYKEIYDFIVESNIEIFKYSYLNIIYLVLFLLVCIIMAGLSIVCCYVHTIFSKEFLIFLVALFGLLNIRNISRKIYYKELRQEAINNTVDELLKIYHNSKKLSTKEDSAL